MNFLSYAQIYNLQFLICNTQLVISNLLSVSTQFLSTSAFRCFAYDETSETSIYASGNTFHMMFPEPLRSTLMKIPLPIRYRPNICTIACYLTTDNPDAFDFAKIIRPAEVCKTLVTTISTSEPLNLLASSTTTIVPSSR